MKNIIVKQVTRNIKVVASGRRGVAGIQGIQGIQGPPGTTDYNELQNKPVLGTAAATSITAYATAAQGVKADTAVQPADLDQTASDLVDAIAAHVLDQDNPHEVTKAQVGLSNVPNVDATKRDNHTGTQLISTITNLQAALDSKATPSDISTALASLVDASPATLDTLNELAAALGDDPNFATTITTLIGTKADTTALTTHTSNTTNPHATTKAQVGLGNVDNTSDVSKPISTATQTALNAKASTTDLTTATAAHLAAPDPHTQYLNDDRADARLAASPYAVMAKSKFASIPSTWGMLGKKFGNNGYENDLQVFGESTQAGTPTPDVPVAIVSTSGNVTVRSVAKNMFNKTASIVSNMTLDASNNAVNASGEFYQSEYISVLPSVSIYASQTGTNSLKVYEYDINKNFIKRTTPGGSFTTVLTATTQFIRVAATIAVIDTIQIEFGSTQTAYNPHLLSTSTLPLSTTQLRSLPNGVSDRIYKSGSSWFREQNVDYLELGGTSNWTQDGTTGTHSRYYSAAGTVPRPLVTTTTNGYSNRFPVNGGGYGTDNVHAYVSGAGLIQIYLPTTIVPVNDVPALKTWLGANPTNFQFQLVTPITTQITDTPLITALENIRTYQGITNITASTPVSGSYKPDPTTLLDAKLNKTGDTATGKITFNAGIAIADNQNIELSATTGTRIGTSTTQKMGFYNATPIVRPSATPANATDLATAIALANNLKAKLIALGLIS